jgi:site-specific DNA-methyltransferase (adenine-specific)
MKLLNGDCLELMKELPSGSVDLVLTDPPYGMGFQSHRRKEVYAKIKNDTSLEWLDGYFAECSRILKDDTAVYCFCSWHNVDIFKKAFEKYFKLKNIIVWVKNNHGSGDLKASYAPKHEFILYGNKGRRTFYGKRMEDVIFANKTKNENHPTEKPIDLLEQFINNSTEKNAVVFDGFMGSGSTGVACVNTNRDFIDIELDENYFNIAKKRIEEAKECQTQKH